MKRGKREIIIIKKKKFKGKRKTCINENFQIIITKKFFLFFLKRKGENILMGFIIYIISVMTDT